MSRIIALVGPTAVGKTEVSIELAQRLDAQIVGCDSMQVYRRMPILTQQPTPAQRTAVSHHLIDCIEPSRPFSVGQYRRMALEAIEQIQRRGKSVLIVGGTGLYLKALTDGLCNVPPADPQLRTSLWMTARERGSPALHERLRVVDPEAAAKIHPHDAKRLVRALEVYEQTGEPLSGFWHRTNGHQLEMPLLGLTRDRAELYERINRRVERMIGEEGVLDEVKQLLALPLSDTAGQVHGLRFLEAYLKGKQTVDDTIRLWQQQVRHYCRRQLIWFRAEPRIQWIQVGSEEPTESIVDRILGSLQLTANSVQTSQ